MYKIVLVVHDYTTIDGEFKRIETTHRFEVPSIAELMQMVGSMAEASKDDLELRIIWEDAEI